MIHFDTIESIVSINQNLSVLPQTFLMVPMYRNVLSFLSVLFSAYIWSYPIGTSTFAILKPGSNTDFNVQIGLDGIYCLRTCSSALNIMIWYFLIIPWPPYSCTYFVDSCGPYDFAILAQISSFTIPRLSICSVIIRWRNWCATHWAMALPVMNLWSHNTYRANFHVGCPHLSTKSSQFHVNNTKLNFFRCGQMWTADLWCANDAVERR